MFEMITAVLKSNLSAPIINSLGLLFDIAGAILVAIDIVEPFKGREFPNMGELTDTSDIKKTPECRLNEKRNYQCMFIGLVFLIIGFVLQIVSTWMARASTT